MSAIPVSISPDGTQPADNSSEINSAFLKLLPVVTTHAKIKFRHLRKSDREEAIAEAQAAALINLHRANRNDKADRVTPGTLAHFSVLHVRAGRHVGGSVDSTTDVLSAAAQRRGGFRVLGLRRNGDVYDCMHDPTAPVWRQVLLEDKSTPPSDQAAFRIDLGTFLSQQHDRTRTMLSMLAAGHKQIEVADHLGVTPSAVCQRQRRAGREWDRFQGVEAEERPACPDTAPKTAVA